MYIPKKLIDRLVFLGIGLATGSMVTFLVTKKVIQDRADEEISDIRRHYMRKATEATSGDKVVMKNNVKPDIEEIFNNSRDRAATRRILIDHGYIAEEDAFVPNPDDPPTIVTALGETVEVEEASSEFDLAGSFASLSFKSKGKPYIIAYEEYIEDDGTYEKDTLDWYAGDGTLCDSRDEQVDDIERRVGFDNLDFFGWRSYDENVVYVRNEDISMDFEITFNPGKYSVLVLGNLENDNPNGPKIRRMRMEE